MPRDYHQRALEIRERAAPNSIDVAASLYELGNLSDEAGDVKEATSLCRQSIALMDRVAPGSPHVLQVLRKLIKFQVEAGETEEAKRNLERLRALAEALQQLPADGSLDNLLDEPSSPAQPEARFLSPDWNSEIKGDQVTARLALFSPMPLARYRLWINGRPFGSEQGIPLPAVGERGRILDRDGSPAEKNGSAAVEQGRALDRDDERAAVEKELPPDLAALARQRRYSHYQVLRLTLPVEDTDGAALRIAVVAETTAGIRSERHHLRVRRPQAEAHRGALRVLAIGVGRYAKLPALNYAAADARALTSLLGAQAGDGKLYREAKVRVLADEQATLPAIREALAWFTKDVQPGETLLLSLSGHGVKAGGSFYFATAGLDPQDPSGTGLPWEELLRHLQAGRRKARAVWVLADCCRAAPGLAREKQATGADLRRGVEEGGNLAICTASSGDTPSYESEDLKHGLFTQAWLEALRGEAPDLLYQETPRGKVLTLAGLQFIIDASVTRHARKAGVRQQVEFPRLEGSFSPSQPVFMAVAGR